MRVVPRKLVHFCNLITDQYHRQKRSLGPTEKVPTTNCIMSGRPPKTVNSTGSRDRDRAGPAVYSLVQPSFSPLP